MATICAFALIFDNQARLLLCRRKKDGDWNLPGGACNPGEAPWAAVVREVREEIGIQVQVEQLRGIYWVPRQDDMVLTFVCQGSAADVQPAAEIEEVDWFEREKMPGNMREHHGGRAVDAFAGAAPVMRVDL